MVIEKVSPLIKWVGGKSQLLPVLSEHVPEKLGQYFEPFCGGAALFFHLQPENGLISDLNPRLINFYAQVADDPDAVIEQVRKFASRFGDEGVDRKSVFLELRHLLNKLVPDTPEAAALFLVVNKTAFNGLYRENLAGDFNVPFNNFESIPKFFDEDNLSRASILLRGAAIKEAGFVETVSAAKSGDFVYFDPPYVPLSPTASFTSYTSKSFNELNQLELIDVAKSLRDSGVMVLLSNSYSDWVVENYSKAGFEVNAVSARRNVAAQASSRSRVQEALIRGY
jgi:DNA adenine methylase